MFATLCSNPIAEKAVIGSNIDMNLSVAFEAPLATQTAIQTNQLQRIPLINSCKKGSLTFEDAIPATEVGFTMIPDRKTR